MLINKSYIFWVLTIAAILFLIVSQLIQDGFFMDGLLYTAVSKNLAAGIGTFWNPHFSKTVRSSFHEQPPLYFGLLAIFYKVYGTGMYVERLFMLVFLVITLVYIAKLWNKIFIIDKSLAVYNWLPVLFYISIPVCFWSYANHVEEVVMCAFVLPSIYYAYIALFLNQKTILNLVISGIFVFLSSLTKGPQGLFPITCVVFYWIITKSFSFKKIIVYSFILVGIPILIYATLILINQDVYLSLQEYFSNRFVKTFHNVYATTNNRLEILVRLFTELLPIILVSVAIKIFARKQNFNLQSPENKHKIWWLLSVGLSGSLPLAITTEQRGFYLVTSLPYFALAVSVWLAPTLSALLTKLNANNTSFKIFSYSSIIILIVSVGFCFSQLGNFKRDKAVLTDIYKIGTIIPAGEIVSTSNQTWAEWNIQAYFVRYFYISLDQGTEKRKYFISEKRLPKNLVPIGYQMYPIKTNELNLYILK